VFIAHVHHQGGGVSLAQDAEGVQAPFAADQHVARVAIVAGAFGNGDVVFEAGGTDVVERDCWPAGLQSISNRRTD
jgi:hypothetical protein